MRPSAPRECNLCAREQKVNKYQYNTVQYSLSPRGTRQTRAENFIYSTFVTYNSPFIITRNSCYLHTYMLCNQHNSTSLFVVWCFLTNSIAPLSTTLSGFVCGWTKSIAPPSALLATNRLDVTISLDGTNRLDANNRLDGSIRLAGTGKIDLTNKLGRTMCSACLLYTSDAADD